MKRKNYNNDDLRFLLDAELKGVKNVRALLDDAIERAVERLSVARGKIVISGVGKSGYIAMKIASTMTSLGIPAVFLHPGEAVHGDLGILSKDDGFIAISYNGETKELLRIVRHIKKHEFPIVSITGKARSSLAKLSDVALVIRISHEGSPIAAAPMASTTASLVVGDLLAAGLSLKRGVTKEQFADFHPGGSLGLQLTSVEELMTGQKDIPLVFQDAPFREALHAMNKKVLGITGVVNRGGKLVGVITDGDIRRFLLFKKFSSESIAKDVMTGTPKSINIDASLQEALTLMEKHRIFSLFVLDDKNKPVGIIHMHDIVEDRIV